MVVLRSGTSAQIRSKLGADHQPRVQHVILTIGMRSGSGTVAQSNDLELGAGRSR